MLIPLIRTLILYLILIFSMRLMGKRQVGELEPAELIITILLSELANVPMQDPGTPILYGVIPILTLVSLEILLSFGSLKSRRMRRWLNGQPAILIRRGKPDLKKMRQLRITSEELLEALRQNNIASIGDVRYGILEANGTLSYVLTPDKQPVTAGMLGLSPANSGVPLVVISEGKIIRTNLEQLHMTEDSLRNLLKKKNISRPEEVFLMTIDDCGNQYLCKEADL